MRIVAGMHRGRTLVAPKGHSTRPTADKTRQAIFNVLEHASWSEGLEGRRVIDLFAGAGGLGLEALSRGAAFALFVETDLAARDALTRNIDALGVAARARLLPLDAARLGAAPGLKAAFDLAFLDPPYGQGLAAPALAALAAGDWLASGALAVVERGADEGPLNAPAWTVLDERLWGAARVSFLVAPTPPSTALGAP